MIRSKDFFPQEDVRIELGNWARRIRERHQMTYHEFAHRLGYKNPASTYALENGFPGSKTMNLYVIKRICEEFKVHCFIHIKENGKVTVS